ncbi:MAG TPA: lysophospholipid acyltransferase family protein [Gemmatimonadaceae bacterium]|nr:lysophospholipid acyltransferase family protein [Gemmatimonadaceae bacterium]
MEFPKPGPNVPSRGNAFSHWLGRVSYTIAGWKIIGNLPDIPKFVLIVAPHTSNWDFFVGVGALFGLGLRVSFLGKDSIFVPPFAQILRWLGGIPVDRSISRDRVAEMVDAFNSHDRLILGLTPEGTRTRVQEWRTGFYHVAVGAKVPIVPVAFDYGKKALIIDEPFYPTGNATAEIATLRAWFANVTPKRPENFAP